MNNILIVDTREKKNERIIKYFDKIGQDYIFSKLDFADYMYYKDYEKVVERKNSLLELSGNLCHIDSHHRFVREIERAKEKGCKHFYIMIAEQKIKSVEEVANWSSTRTKVKGETLMKIMNTMSERYGVEFIFTTKEKAGEKVIELLGGIGYDVSEINF